MFSNIKAFIFDLDDTIVETERLNVELIRLFFSERWHVELDDEDGDFVFGHAWRHIFDFLIEKYRLPTTADDVQEGFLAKKKTFLEKSTIRVAKGVGDVLRLPQRKVIVTGSGLGEARMILEKVGLLRSFDAVFSVDDYKNGKPMPDGFIMALDYLSIEPDCVLAFEDAKAGIEAASKAGVIPVFIREFARFDVSAMARFSFDDFSDFLAHFIAP